MARRIGYARVSTEDQDLSIQRAALERDGCAIVFEENRSGKKRVGREQLDLALRVLTKGDTLVVTRLDRLGRSLRDLANIAHEIDEGGAQRTVTLIAENLARAPVRLTQFIDTPTGRVGYILLNTFSPFASEKAARDAVAAMQTADVAVLTTDQVIALTTALTFPLTMYEGFTREHEFGLSNQAYEQWFNEFLIGSAVGLIMGGIFLTVLYGIIRRAPNTWWIWGAGASAAFFAVAALIAPVFISPLFNDYKPMREGPLKQEILSLARANAIPVTDVFEVDASRQSKRISANVQGFLGTTRISLNDNLLNRSTPAEVRAVMAHEMGHYVLGHVNELIAYASILSLIAFAIAHFGFLALTSVFGGLWGIRGITDPAGFAVLSMLLSVIGLVGTPFTNTMIRSNEAEADIFGLNASREPDGFAEAALLLSEYRKMEPSALEEWFFYDHPSGYARIRMAMTWKAGDVPPRAVTFQRHGRRQVVDRGIARRPAAPDRSTGRDPDADDQGHEREVQALVHARRARGEEAGREEQGVAGQEEPDEQAGLGEHDDEDPDEANRCDQLLGIEEVRQQGENREEHTGRLVTTPMTVRSPDRPSTGWLRSTRG